VNKRKPIAVVAGWIENKGRILLTKRPPIGPNGGLWELPGGKIEAGETPQEALRREIEEELGLSVYPRQVLASVSYAYPHILVRLVATLATSPTRLITPIGCADFRWLTLAEALNLIKNRTLQLAPADKMLIKRVLSF
jgi:8-oxo-dGTP diphosphatase